MKSTAQVADGITFVEAGVLSMLEGYTVDRNPELDVNRIDITTPNNDPKMCIRDRSSTMTRKA